MFGPFRQMAPQPYGQPYQPQPGTYPMTGPQGYPGMTPYPTSGLQGYPQTYPAQTQSYQGSSTGQHDRRLTEHERRISQLERRVARLESMVMGQPRAVENEYPNSDFSV